MADELLDLEITDQAQIAYSALGPEDRRLVDAWFDHLRNWPSDEFVRSQSKRLLKDDDLYAFQTTSDLVIVFRVIAGQVSILSIFRKEALRRFAANLERETV